MDLKFRESFRVRIKPADFLRFLVERESGDYVEDAVLCDLGVGGLGFNSSEEIAPGEELSFSLQFRNRHLDVFGKVARAERDGRYGVALEEGPELSRFLDSLINSFSPERVRECLREAVFLPRPFPAPNMDDERLGLRRRMIALEGEILQEEIRRCRGNKSEAARVLGISREGLRKKLRAVRELTKKAA